MTHPHLEGLIRKWREEAQRFAGMHGTDHAHFAISGTLKSCADELESALAALPGGGVEGWQPIESAPNKQVLLFYPPMYRMGTKQETHGVYYRVGYPGETPRKPTHWWQLTAPQSSLPTPSPHEADRNG